MEVREARPVELDGCRLDLSIEEPYGDAFGHVVNEGLINLDACGFGLASFKRFVHDGEPEILNVTYDTLHNVLSFQRQFVVYREIRPSLILNIYIIPHSRGKVKNYLTPVCVFILVSRRTNVKVPNFLN